jgi:transcriptional antiterminator RfaH
MQVQKLRNQRVQVVTEPMFSRYLFIQLDDETQNWGPIRSTLGVSKLVSFGPQPAKVPPAFVAFLQNASPYELERMFSPGDTVQVAAGPIRGLEGRYLTHDGDMRAFVLIELLGQPQRLCMELETLRVA